MKNIVYYLTMQVLQIYAFDRSPCLEPQLIVKETYCHSSNTTERAMQVITDELLDAENFTEAVLTNNDCSITEFDTHFEITDTFYINCETEYDCLEEETEARNSIFVVECGDPEERSYVLQDILGKQSKIVNTGHKDDDGSSKLVILASSLVGAGAAVATGFGIYKLKTLLQSGSYMFPPGPSTTGFTEMA